jgi:hypothetical protein
MNCDKVKSLIGWFHDGELSAADNQMVAEHLEHCPDCAAELAGLKELDRTSKWLATPTVPAGLWDRIASRLPHSNRGVNTGRNRLGSRRRFLLAVGTVAAGIITGIVAYWRPPRKLLEFNPPITPHDPGPSDSIQANLASLTPDDRRLVEAQRICLADGCGARLGEGGPPRRVVLQNQPIFFCCEGCERWARTHPSAALAKLHRLEHRDGKSGHEP